LSCSFKTKTKIWLVTLLLFRVSASPVAAQTTLLTPSTQLSDSIVQAAREDTTYALQRLFFEKRRRNVIYGALMSPVVLISGLRVYSSYAQASSNETKLITSLVGSGYLLLFARRFQLIYRYRVSREKKLTLAIQEGQPLPYKIRRSLKKEYFSTNNVGK
jgi:hypothetical protein